MADKDPWNISVELENGVDSTMYYTGADGNIVPQRLVLHEAIVQAVSERKILAGQLSYEEALKDTIEKVKTLPSFQALEQTGDYGYDKISNILDDLGLERLPLHARAEQVMMVTGGAGSGKSRLVDSLELENPDIYQNAVQINPDDFKDLLANKIALGEQHASYTHWESSMIADTVMERLDDRMSQSLPAPHVLMDVFLL